MSSQTALADLIKDRCIVLGLTPQELGHRLGYINPAKAAGRVHALCSPSPFSIKSQRAIRRLPSALEISPDEIERARFITDRTIEALAAIKKKQALVKTEAIEQAWRLNFKSHAVLLTVCSMPMQISLCAYTGGARRWLYIFLDTARSPVSFVSQAVSTIPSMIRTSDNGKKYVPFFGEVTGVVINFLPDSAIHCDLSGRPVQILKKAYRPGVFGLSADRPLPLTSI